MHLNVLLIVDLDIVGVSLLCAGLGHNLIISVGYNMNRIAWELLV